MRTQDTSAESSQLVLDVALSSARSAPLRLPRTVNGTGHTGPSEFCATSI